MNPRVKILQQCLSPRQAMLVTDGASRRYLSGFSSSAGQILITRQNVYFLIDFRYYEKAAATVRGMQVCLSAYQTEEIGRLMAENGAEELLVETERLTVSELKALREKLPQTEISQEDTLDRKLEAMRVIKTAEEVACIRRAQQMTEDTFEYVLGRIAEGRSERDVMLDMEFYMRRLGSEGVSFDFIVVSGENSSLPHGVPTDRKIRKGDFVTMDFGAVVGGYHSDMTRTVAVGQITEQQKRVYDTVLGAQLKALEMIGPNMICNQVDRAAREYIDKAGYEGCFGHGLGHGVGLEIHEAPAFNKRCETVLAPGMILTVEPGIYLENQFGVRIEDMVWITEEGYENLTKAPKQLIIL